jgi:hypothetical protein
MGVACDLSPDRAKPKTLTCVIGRLLDPAIIQNDAFGAAAFKEQLAIIRAIRRCA